MQKFKKLISSMLAFAMIFTSFTMPAHVMAADEQVNLTVLATSDIHGKIYPWEYSTDSTQEFGLAKLATLIKAERQKDPNLMLVDSGDTIESNMIDLFNADAEHPMIKVFDLLKYDTWTLGNHEFNFGLDVLGKAIKTFTGKVLSANIVKADGKTFVNPYYIKDVKGVKVAILGLTTPFIPRWEASAPDHFAGLTFLDPLATAQKYVDILKNTEKVDVIIGTFHIGQNSEGYDPAMMDSVRTICEKVKGIDAVVVGHAHDTFGTADKQVLFGDTIALEPASNGAFLGKINLTLTKAATGYKVTAKNTDLITTTKVTPDPEVLSAMKYVDDRSKTAAYEVIGTASADFLPAEAVKGIPTAQVQDTPVVDLINTVQMFYTKADISAAALFDSRSNLKKGELQFKDAALIYKYSNTLQAHKISGKNLKAYMEWSASYYNTQVDGDVTVSFNENVRGYNYDMFSGLNYKIDITKPAGQRITDVTFKGKPLDDNAEYTLAINNYRVGTLQSLKLLPADGSSCVYDSVFTPTPEMQRLIQKYIKEELKGVADPKVDNNWSIAKKDNSSLTGAKEAIELVNKGFMDLPMSGDSRTPNVKSINVLQKADPAQITAIAKKANVTLTADVSKLTNGEAYKMIADASKIPADTIPVQVIAFNDFHGALTTTGDTDKNMGASKFAKAIKDEVAKAPASTIVVSAGDNYNGSALSNLLYGKPVSDMLKYIGIVGSAVGNHEFDWGLDKLPVWSKDMNAPFIAANIYDKTTNKPVDWAKPYIIKEVNGVKVAFIGLTTQETAFKTKPENVKTIEFKNPVEIAEVYVPQARKEGAEIVILLTHIGTSQDAKGVITFEAGAEKLPYVNGVDAIITGHSHLTVNGVVNNVPVVQAYYNGRTIDKLNFYVDKTTRKVVSKTGSLDELYKRKAGVENDATMQAMLASYLKEVSPVLDEKLGETKLDMPHDKNGLSVLGIWTSEVMKDAAKAQIAFTNGGGIRTSINAGTITMGNMYEVMPFDNVLSSFDMTGAQVKEILEHGIENAEVGSVQFAGITVEYVKGAPKGSKVVKVVLDNGEELQDAKVYRVVTNDFMATGGDGFVTFTKAKYLGDTVPIRDVMVDAVKKAKVLNYVPNQLMVAPGTIKVAASTVTPVATGTSSVPTVAANEYVVKKGDNLWKIGKELGMKWQDLAKYNKLKNPEMILPGQKILVPAN